MRIGSTDNAAQAVDNTQQTASMDMSMAMLKKALNADQQAANELLKNLTGLGKNVDVKA